MIGVTLTQLEAIASRAPTRAMIQARRRTTSPTDVFSRARNYLKMIPGAVTGQRGHDRTFYAANRLVRGYGIDPDAAFPLLAEWNLTCNPPWSEYELRRKLEQAARQPGPRGFLLTSDPLPASVHARKDGTAAGQFRNYVWDEVPDGETMRKVRRGRSTTDMLEDVLRYTGGWPRRIGKLLFAPGPQGRIQWIESSSDLFAWLISEFASEGRSGLDWTSGNDCATKQEFYAHCTRICEGYDSIELYPHAPSVPGAFYHHSEPTGGDGSALNKLISFFEPDTPEDDDLIRAFFLTLFWGGPAGKRPLFIFEAAASSIQGGRGAGKSTVVQVAGRLVGGLLTFDPGEPLRDIHARLLSPPGRESRLVCFDNVKTLRLSSAGLEGMITSDVLSGRQMYQGEGKRLNTLTWSLTFNEPSLGKDLARRSLSIRLRPPTYRPDWEAEVNAHIETHRWAIVGDCIAELQRPTEMPAGFKYSRWPVWERQVLGQMADPIRLQRLIEERRAELDDDDRIGEEVGAVIAAVVAGQFKYPHNPDAMKILIPAGVLHEQVVKKFQPDIRTSAHASRWLSTVPIPRFSKHNATVPYRGFIWRGSECPDDAQLTPWAE